MTCSTLAGAVSALLLIAQGRVLSCGVEWAKPKTHFDGVNEYGFVSYWDQIGELDLDEGLAFPLIIGFRSDWQRVSPYLGRGWFFGLMDSFVAQRSENAFDMIQPDGYTVPFGRDDKNPAILHGAKGWKAEISGNTVTAHASCGWTLVFVNGKIARITTPKSQTLTIEREAEGVATSVIEGTKVLLKVERDAKHGVVGLLVGDTRIGIERTERPRIQKILGKNVVVGIDWAVGKITAPDVQPKTYDYAVGDDVQPTLTVGGGLPNERTITWDADTQVIQADGLWTYEIKPAEVSGHNAAIGRTGPRGTREFWHYDEAVGKETVIKADGTQLSSSWFTSGNLAGALRKREEIVQGKARTTYLASYDEKGKLFREVLENGEINEFTYGKDGTKLVQTRVVDGKPVYAVNYKGGRISTVRSADGRTLQYFYDDRGREVKLMINGKTHSEKSYAPDGTWEKEVVFDEGGAAPSRTFYREFDAQGRTALDTIIESQGGYPEIRKRYFYDSLGRLEKQIDSQQGTILYLDGSDGQRIAKVLK